MVKPSHRIIDGEVYIALCNSPKVERTQWKKAQAENIKHFLKLDGFKVRIMQILDTSGYSSGRVFVYTSPRVTPKKLRWVLFQSEMESARRKREGN